MSFIKKTPATPVNSEFKIELVPNPSMKFSEGDQASAKQSH